MSRNLVVDIGNTRQKVAVFQNGKLVGKVMVDKPGEVIRIKKILKQRSFQGLIISTVHKKLPQLGAQVRSMNVLRFTTSTPVPLKNKYRSKFTLGSDRLAAAVGASKLFKGSPVLVVDAGTCIKFNFIDISGAYFGGSISPGIQMRFKALHNFTARLPFPKSGGASPLIGSSTDESIRSGVINGAVEEVKGMINEYYKRYNKLKVVITGGDGPLFVKSLKMRIFARPNLVLEGLNEILEFNA